MMLGTAESEFCVPIELGPEKAISAVNTSYCILRNRRDDHKPELLRCCPQTREWKREHDSHGSRRRIQSGRLLKKSAGQDKEEEPISELDARLLTKSLRSEHVVRLPRPVVLILQRG